MLTRERVHIRDELILRAVAVMDGVTEVAQTSAAIRYSRLAIKAVRADVRAAMKALPAEDRMNGGKRLLYAMDAALRAVQTAERRMMRRVSRKFTAQAEPPRMAAASF